RVDPLKQLGDRRELGGVAALERRGLRARLDSLGAEARRRARCSLGAQRLAATVTRGRLVDVSVEMIGLAEQRRGLLTQPGRLTCETFACLVALLSLTPQLVALLDEPCRLLCGGEPLLELRHASGNAGSVVE